MRWPNSLPLLILIVSMASGGIAPAAEGPALSLKPDAGYHRHPILLRIPGYPVHTRHRGLQFTFTLDGSDPTGPGAWVFDGCLLLADDESIRMAARHGEDIVWQHQAAYTVDVQLVPERPQITIERNAEGVLVATVSSGTDGTCILVTTDGSRPRPGITPTYEGPIEVSPGDRIVARAYGGRVEVMRGKKPILLPAVFPSGFAFAEVDAAPEPPTLAPAPGLYHQPIAVEVTHPDDGVELFYHLGDPSTVDWNGAPAYTIPIDLASPTSLLVRARDADGLWSEVAGGEYGFAPLAPTIAPAGGVYGAVQEAIVTAPEGATAEYRIDGGAWSPVTGPIVIGTSLLLEARAVRAGWSPSEVVAADYELTAPPIQLLPAGGEYFTEVVAYVEPQEGFGVQVRFDGGEWQDLGAPTDPILVASGATVAARFVREGWTSGPAAEQTYSFRCPAPAIPAASGIAYEPIAFTASLGIDDAQLEVAVDGGEWVATTLDQAVDQAGAYAYRCVRDGWASSVVVERQFDLTCYSPVPSELDGEYFGQVALQVSAPTPGSIVRWTEDGSEPVATSPQWSGPILIADSATLKYAAFRPGFATSEVITQTFTILPAPPTLSLVDASLSVGEGAGEMGLRVASNHAFPRSVWFQIEFEPLDEGATPTFDRADLGDDPPWIELPADQQALTVPYTVLDDPLHEGDQRWRARITRVRGGGFDQFAEGTAITVVDDDPAPVLGFESPSQRFGDALPTPIALPYDISDFAGRIEIDWSYRILPDGEPVAVSEVVSGGLRHHLVLDPPPAGWDWQAQAIEVRIESVDGANLDPRRASMLIGGAGVANTAPTGLLTAQELAGPTGHPYLFQVEEILSDDPHLFVEWEFGDGGTASGEEVAHVYAAAGEYTVTATLRDPFGLSTVLSHELTVLPTASLSPRKQRAALDEGGATRVLSWTRPDEELGEAVTYRLVAVSGDAATILASPAPGDTFTLAAGEAALELNLQPRAVDGSPAPTAVARLTLQAVGRSAPAADILVALIDADGPYIPPEPADIRPRDRVPEGMSFAESVAFLHADEPPVIRDADQGDFDPSRVAILRGRVLDRQGDPVVGALVRILNRDGFGWTRTRTDGRYDMVVDGGARVTVSVEPTGAPEVQRQLFVPTGDFTLVEDIFVTPYDPTSSAVEFGSADYQFANGSVMADEDGERQIVMAVRPGTTASLRMPDGSTAPAGVLTFRFTEYTTDPDVYGTATMPADLPERVAYTYCFEATADEAEDLGAESVEFSQPVYLFSDNFLSFPIGTIVPSAYYDRTAGRWVAAENTVVIALVDGDEGARVDIDGDGAGTPEEAAQVGIDDAFLAALEQRYAAPLGYDGRIELWVGIAHHFTPYDWNCAEVVDSDGSLETDVSHQGLVVNNPARIVQPSIDIDNQSPHPVISVGDDAALIYHDLNIGRPDLFDAAGQHTVSGSDENLDGELSIQWQVGGRIVLDQSYGSLAEVPESTEHQWDGRDVYGQRRQEGILTVVSRSHWRAGIYAPRVSSEPIFEGHPAWASAPANLVAEARRARDRVHTARIALGATVRDGEPLGASGWRAYTATTSGERQGVVAAVGWTGENVIGSVPVTTAYEGWVASSSLGRASISSAVPFVPRAGSNMYFERVEQVAVEGSLGDAYIIEQYQVSDGGGGYGGYGGYGGGGSENHYRLWRCRYQDGIPGTVEPVIDFGTAAPSDMVALTDGTVAIAFPQNIAVLLVDGQLASRPSKELVPQILTGGLDWNGIGRVAGSITFLAAGRDGEWAYLTEREGLPTAVIMDGEREVLATAVPADQLGTNLASGWSVLFNGDLYPWDPMVGVGAAYGTGSFWSRLGDGVGADGAQVVAAGSRIGIVASGAVETIKEGQGSVVLDAAQPLEDAFLSISDLAMLPDGSILVADRYRVARVAYVDPERTGPPTAIERDGSSRIARLVPATGPAVEILYDGEDRPEAFLFENGRTISIGYRSDLLVSLDDSEGDPLLDRVEIGRDESMRVDSVATRFDTWRLTRTATVRGRTSVGHEVVVDAGSAGLSMLEGLGGTRYRQEFGGCTREVSVGISGPPSGSPSGRVNSAGYLLAGVAYDAWDGEPVYSAPGRLALSAAPEAAFQSKVLLDYLTTTPPELEGPRFDLWTFGMHAPQGLDGGAYRADFASGVRAFDGRVASELAQPVIVPAQQGYSDLLATGAGQSAAAVVTWYGVDGVRQIAPASSTGVRLEPLAIAEGASITVRIVGDLPTDVVSVVGEFDYVGDEPGEPVQVVNRFEYDDAGEMVDRPDIERVQLPWSTDETLVAYEFDLVAPAESMAVYRPTFVLTTSGGDVVSATSEADFVAFRALAKPVEVTQLATVTQEIVEFEWPGWSEERKEAEAAKWKMSTEALEPHVYFLDPSRSDFRRWNYSTVPRDLRFRILGGRDNAQTLTDRGESRFMWVMETPEFEEYGLPYITGEILLRHLRFDITLSEDYSMAPPPVGASTLLGNTGTIAPRWPTDVGGEVRYDLRPQQRRADERFRARASDRFKGSDGSTAVATLGWKDAQTLEVTGRSPGDGLIAIDPFIDGFLNIPRDNWPMVGIPVPVDLPVISEPSPYQLEVARQNLELRRQWAEVPGNSNPLVEVPTPLPPGDGEPDPFWVAPQARGLVFDQELTDGTVATRELDAQFELATYLLAQMVPGAQWAAVSGRDWHAMFTDPLLTKFPVPKSHGSDTSAAVHTLSLEQILLILQAGDDSLDANLDRFRDRLLASGPPLNLWARTRFRFFDGSYLPLSDVVSDDPDATRPFETIQARAHGLLNQLALLRLKRYFSLKHDFQAGDLVDRVVFTQPEAGGFEVETFAMLGDVAMPDDSEVNGWLDRLLDDNIELLFDVEILPEWRLGHPYTETVLRWMMAERISWAEESLRDLIGTSPAYRIAHTGGIGPCELEHLPIEVVFDGERIVARIPDAFRQLQPNGDIVVKRAAGVCEDWILRRGSDGELLGEIELTLDNLAPLRIPIHRMIAIPGDNFQRTLTYVPVKTEIGCYAEAQVAAVLDRIAEEMVLLREAMGEQKAASFWQNARKDASISYWLYVVGDWLSPVAALYELKSGKELATGEGLDSTGYLIAGGSVLIEAIPGFGKGLKKGWQLLGDDLARAAFKTSIANMKDKGLRRVLADFGRAQADEAAALLRRPADMVAFGGTLLRANADRIGRWLKEGGTKVALRLGGAGPYGGQMVVRKGAAVPHLSPTSFAEDGVTRQLPPAQVLREEPDGITPKTSGEMAEQVNDEARIASYIDEIAEDGTGAADAATAIRAQQDLCCFPAGTLVALAGGGMRPIEEIEVGDMVLARSQHDPDSAVIARRVTRTFTRTSNSLVRILARTAAGGSFELLVTPEHPFRTSRDDWAAAADVRAGERLRGGSESFLVEEVTPVPVGVEVPVFNFEVEGDHTYFVATIDPETEQLYVVWVHNRCYADQVAEELVERIFSGVTGLLAKAKRIAKVKRMLLARNLNEPAFVPGIKNVIDSTDSRTLLRGSMENVLGGLARLFLRGKVAAHHLIPVKVFETGGRREILDAIGFQLNHWGNGIYLKTKQVDEFVETGLRHAGNHQGYSAAVAAKLDEVMTNRIGPDFADVAKDPDLLAQRLSASVTLPNGKPGTVMDLMQQDMMDLQDTLRKQLLRPDPPIVVSGSKFETQADLMDEWLDVLDVSDEFRPEP